MRVLRAAFVAAVLVAGAVLLAPASLLDRVLAGRTQDRVRLMDAHGFWWHGSGVLATTDGRSRVPLAWRVALLPLATGTLVADVGAGGNDAMPSGRVRLARGSIEVHDLQLHLPATFVGAIVPALGALSLGGEVAVRAPALAWRQGTFEGRGDATWQHARIVAAGLALDLGSVSASAAPGRDTLNGTVRNSGGDVGIDGTFAQRAGALEASLVLTPSRATPEMVRGMLPLLGASDGSGAVRVTWRSDR